jgi:hypothetical protein
MTPYNGSVVRNGFVYLFLQVFKNSKFHSKAIGVSLRFYRKSLVWFINWPTLRISWLGPQYYGSVIHNGPIYDFLLVFEKFKFLLKIHRCQPTILPKSPVWGQKLTETLYFLVVTVIYECLWILKKNKFSPVYRKTDRNRHFGGKNWPKLNISCSWTP